MRRKAYVLALLVATATHRRAQEEDDACERVPVRVTSVAGEGVYIDRGRDACLEVGDELRLLGQGGGTLFGTITAVSRTSARATLALSAREVELGATGEVLVPRARLRPAAVVHPPAREPPHPPVEVPEVSEPVPTRPPHPGWTRPPEEWSADVPLLAPVDARRAAERERRLRGSLWASFDGLRERGEDERAYAAARMGLELELESPFARSDALRFEGELTGRRVDEDGGDESDGHARIDRLSYRLGGVRGRPDLLEVGRFLQNGFSELGVLDGVEYVRRSGSGHRLGASMGFLPEPDDLFHTGEDLQVALAYHYLPEDLGLGFGAGLQKTWHEGVPDRDLVLATLDWQAGERTSLYASVQVDHYGSDDAEKSAGFELTDLFVNARRRFDDGHALGLFVARSRFPALLRDEFPALDGEQIRDDVFDRVGLDGRYACSARADVYARGELWRDQDDSGSSASVRLALRDFPWRDGALALEPYYAEGKYHSGAGLRASLAHALRTRLLDGELGLDWDTGAWEQDDFDGPGSDIVENVLRARWETRIGTRWSLALYVEGLFGDEDGRALGLILRRSFG